MQFSLRRLVLFVTAFAVIAGIVSSPAALWAVVSVLRQPAFWDAALATGLSAAFFMLGSRLVQRERIDHPIVVAIAIACYALLAMYAAGFYVSAFYHAGDAQIRP